MIPKRKVAEARELASDLRKKRSELAALFVSVFEGIEDWTWLTDAPRAGVVELNGERWDFHRHGSGIQFKSMKNGMVVDIESQVREPKFDATNMELAEFAESLGLQGLELEGVVYLVADPEAMTQLVTALRVPHP